MKSRLAGAAAILAAMVAMVATSAMATTYRIAPTTLSDGTTVVSGTFDYDSVAGGPLTAVNITETGNTPGTYTFPGLRSAATAAFAQRAASIGTANIDANRAFYIDTAPLQPTGTFTDVRLGIGRCSTVVGGQCFNSTVGANNSGPGGTYPTFIEVVTIAAPVPTLSEWAMILFGLMLAGGSAVYIQRQRLAL